MSGHRAGACPGTAWERSGRDTLGHPARGKLREGAGLAVLAQLQAGLPAAAGHAAVYPSSTLHPVAPVTRGERLAAVTWVQSHVRDPARREILYDVYRMRETLAKLDPDGEAADLTFKTHANLLRMWSE